MLLWDCMLLTSSHCQFSLDMLLSLFKSIPGTRSWIFGCYLSAEHSLRSNVLSVTSMSWPYPANPSLVFQVIFQSSFFVFTLDPFSILQCCCFIVIGPAGTSIHFKLNLLITTNLSKISNFATRTWKPSLCGAKINLRTRKAFRRRKKGARCRYDQKMVCSTFSRCLWRTWSLSCKLWMG